MWAFSPLHSRQSELSVYSSLWLDHDTSDRVSRARRTHSTGGFGRKPLMRAQTDPWGSGAGEFPTFSPRKSLPWVFFTSTALP